MASPPSKYNVSAKSKKKKKKKKSVFCHQCHKKTKDLLVSCKNEDCDNPCNLQFCRPCLLKRYGEKAEEADLLNDWTCPRCRGICNCCICRKKQDRKPNDVRVHEDKATRFSSDLEMLQAKGPESVGLEMDYPKNEVASDKGKEILFYDKSDSKSNSNPANSTPVSDDKKSEEGLEALGDAKKHDNDGTCSGQSSAKIDKVSVPVCEEKKNPKKRVSDIEVCLMEDQDFGVLNASKDGDGGACPSQRDPKRPRVSERVPVKEMKAGEDCLIKPHVEPRHDGTNDGFLTSNYINPRIFLLAFSVGICTLGLGRMLG